MALCLSLAACQRAATPAAGERAAAASKTSASSQERKAEPFEIRGTVPEMKDGTEVSVILDAVGSEARRRRSNDVNSNTDIRPQPVATAIVKDGKFVMRGTIDLVQGAYIHVTGGDSESLINLYLYGGQFELVPDGKGYYEIRGNQYSDRIHAYARTPEYIAKRKAFDEAWAKNGGKKPSPELQSRVDALMNAMQQLEYAHLESIIHSDKESIPLRIFAMQMHVDTRRLSHEKRLELLAQFERGIGPHPDIDSQRKQAQNAIRDVQTQKAWKAGMPYKPVAGVDINGRQIALADVLKQNKLVMLDVWASWCEICRAAFPNVKKIRDRYHAQGFEVYAISIDDEKDAWLKAMQEEGSADFWINVLDPRGGESQVVRDYGVDGVPLSVLITADGKMQVMALGEEEKTYAYIRDFFAKKR